MNSVLNDLTFPTNRRKLLRFCFANLPRSNKAQKFIEFITNSNLGLSERMRKCDVLRWFNMAYNQEILDYLETLDKSKKYKPKQLRLIVVNEDTSNYLKLFEPNREYDYGALKGKLFQSFIESI
tara:strand:- start:49 stop:420 length:372 start_codon:yes stop_codon:yes gene_type:complete